MLFNIDNLINATITAATFGLVLSLWIGVILYWSIKRKAREKTVRQRVQLDRPDAALTRPMSLWHEGHAVVVQRPIRLRLSLTSRVDAKLKEAGWELDIRYLRLGAMAAVVVSPLLSYVATGSFIPGVGAVALAALLSWFLLQGKINRRSALFEVQFIDALDIAARSLRAGHPLVGAFQLIANEIPPPLGALFAKICQTQELGQTIEQAILDVSRDFGNADVKIFATSIAIQIRSGGNLADMMDRLAAVMRDRMRVHRRVRVLIAQTQISKRILAALPVVIFFVLNTLNPEYMRVLYTTDAGKILLSSATLCILFGIWVMNRLSVIHY